LIFSASSTTRHAVPHVGGQAFDARLDLGADEGLILGCQGPHGLDRPPQLDWSYLHDVNRNRLVRGAGAALPSLSAGADRQDERNDR
jgi:hypothetical protein